MKIKLSKIILESALLFKAKNDVRHYLNGILFRADGRVMATNGHIAFIGDGHESGLKEDVIIDIGKSPTSKYKYAEICTESGIASYVDIFNNRVGVGMASVIEGNFPDVDRVLNVESAQCDTIGFNAEYINLIGKSAKMFDPSNRTISVTVNGADKIAVMEMNSPCGLKGKAAVMPVRLK
jgi:DNA polymerase-3 subunit beta